jgi:phage portal protein BeeE
MADKQTFLSKAVNVLRSAFKAKTVVPDLGQQNPHIPYDRSPSYWSRWFSKTTDYRHEVGNLDLNSLAMAVVNFTANRIPEAKPAVGRTTKEGDQKFDYLHPAAQVVRRPNRHNIWANYAGICSMGWWFSGNVYFYKTRAITGEVIELWNLPHFLVEPRWPGDGRTPEVPDDRNNDPFLSHYQYTPPGKAPVLYPAQDVIHLKRGVDPLRPRLGLGAFESLYKELYGDDKMALFTASIMANMGIQVPVITPKDDSVNMTPTAAAAIKEGWIQKTTGTKAGEPVVLDMPFQVDKFGFNPSELDLSQLRLIPESRVCAVCQISPAALQVMVGIQNGTSYASSEQARQQGYEEVIIPIQAVWAQEFTHQLLNEFEDSEGAEFVFDTGNVRVLQEDQDSKVERETRIFAAGGSTLDQYLMAVGKKPVGPPLGDIRMVPGLSTPMSPEQLLEIASKAPEPTSQPPIDPATLAKFADMDRYLEKLDNQMAEFMKRNANPR